MRISDWSSDVCSSDLSEAAAVAALREGEQGAQVADRKLDDASEALSVARAARAGAAARTEALEARRQELNRIAGERFECLQLLPPERVGYGPDVMQIVVASGGERVYR